MDRTTSPAWNYFTKVEGEHYAKCLKCESLILCVDMRTGGMVKHLKNLHSIDARVKFRKEIQIPQRAKERIETTKRKPVWNFFTNESGRDYAKCVKCGSKITCKDMRVRGLVRHLRNVHSINVGLFVEETKQISERYEEKIEKDNCSSRSPAWDHFTRVKGRNHAKCLKCGTLIQCINGYASGMVKHLKSMHSIDARSFVMEKMGQISRRVQGSGNSNKHTKNHRPDKHQQSPKSHKKMSQIAAKSFPRANDKLPCSFCKSTVDDEVIYGGMYTIGRRMTCHHFCLLLSDDLEQNGRDDQGILGFMPLDIKRVLHKAWGRKCSYCEHRGATLHCYHPECKVRFHLPCGRKRGALSLFHEDFSSYCSLHRPYQRIPLHIFESRIGEPPGSLRIKLTPVDYKTGIANGNIVSMAAEMTPRTEEYACGICRESIIPMPSAEIFWPPCCQKDRWFHRICVEKLALSAGMHFLKCPLCNNTEVFLEALHRFGFYIPDQDASWEREAGAFSELLERPKSCYVDACHCPRGRNYTSSKWTLLLCETCGSQAAHKQCILPKSKTLICSRCRPDEARSGHIGASSAKPVQRHLPMIGNQTTSLKSSQETSSEPSEPSHSLSICSSSNIDTNRSNVESSDAAPIQSGSNFDTVHEADESDDYLLIRNGYNKFTFRENFKSSRSPSICSGSDYGSKRKIDEPSSNIDTCRRIIESSDATSHRSRSRFFESNLIDSNFETTRRIMESSAFLPIGISSSSDISCEIAKSSDSLPIGIGSNFYTNRTIADSSVADIKKFLFTEMWNSFGKFIDNIERYPRCDFNEPCERVVNIEYLDAAGVTLSDWDLSSFYNELYVKISSLNVMLRPFQSLCALNYFKSCRRLSDFRKPDYCPTVDNRVELINFYKRLVKKKGYFLKNDSLKKEIIRSYLFSPRIGNDNEIIKPIENFSQGIQSDISLDEEESKFRLVYECDDQLSGGESFLKDSEAICSKDSIVSEPTKVSNKRHSKLRLRKSKTGTIAEPKLKIEKSEWPDVGHYKCSTDFMSPYRSKKDKKKSGFKVKLKIKLKSKKTTPNLNRHAKLKTSPVKEEKTFKNYNLYKYFKVDLKCKIMDDNRELSHDSSIDSIDSSHISVIESSLKKTRKRSKNSFQSSSIISVDSSFGSDWGTLQNVTSPRKSGKLVCDRVDGSSRLAESFCKENSAGVINAAASEARADEPSAVFGVRKRKADPKADSHRSKKPFFMSDKIVVVDDDDFIPVVKDSKKKAISKHEMYSKSKTNTIDGSYNSCYY